jgi:probable phosphoglycerate mutase
VELLLIRHGLPVRIERDDGAPADPPLSPEGQEQARRVARWLGGQPIDAIVASPLVRARETAQPLAHARGLEIQIEPGVRELDADSDRYIPLEELKQQDYQAWKAAMAGGLYAGVDVDAFRREVVDAIERTIAAHAGRRVAIVCHGGVINAWASHVLGISELLFFDPYYTSINRFFAASTGERSVASLGETPHLRGDVFPSRAEDAA